MDTQNTSVHLRLWHRNFWMLALTGMLLTMSVYMQIITLPMALPVGAYKLDDVAISMGVYGIGIFLLGSFCSYFVLTKSRRLVCREAILGMVLVDVTMWALGERWIALSQEGTVWAMMALRFLLGAFFGLAEMVLAGSLVIDSCESFLRTEANYVAAWMRRFALALGPLAGLVAVTVWGRYFGMLASALMALLAYVLISFVHLPFKAPEEDIPVFSLDRFFLIHGKWLFVYLVLCTAVVGLLLSLTHPMEFYGMLLAGLLFALLAENFAFANADLKSEIISGLLCIGAATLLLSGEHWKLENYVAPSMIGFGIGLIGSRSLLFYIKLSKHCQRGTSQSSFFLGWESGLTLGLWAGYAVLHGDRNSILLTALVLTVVALIVYNFFIHSWYVRNKNR